MTRPSLIQVTLFTLLSITAFSANAVICRWALDHQLIDPMSFTSLRLGSASAVLFAVMAWFYLRQARAVLLSQSSLHSVQNSAQISRGSWRAAIILFIYTLFFRMVM